MPPQQVQSLQHPPGNGTPILRLPVVIQTLDITLKASKFKPQCKLLIDGVDTLQFEGSTLPEHFSKSLLGTHSRDDTKVEVQLFKNSKLKGQAEIPLWTLLVAEHSTTLTLWKPQKPSGKTKVIGTAEVRMQRYEQHIRGFYDPKSNPGTEGLPTFSRMAELLNTLPSVDVNPNCQTLSRFHLGMLYWFLEEDIARQTAELRRAVDPEQKPIRPEHLRGNALEDTLIQCHTLVVFLDQCRDRATSRRDLHAEKQLKSISLEVMDKVCHVSAILCEYANIYFAATYPTLHSSLSSRRDLSTLIQTQHTLVHLRARMVFLDHGRADSPPESLQEFIETMLSLALPEVREGRGLSDWKMASYTAVLCSFRWVHIEQIYEVIIQKLRMTSASDVARRDELRRLLTHIIQEVDLLPSMLILKNTIFPDKAPTAGVGSYAVVYAGRMKVDNETDMRRIAIKSIKFITSGTLRERALVQLRMYLEVVSCWTLSHPNVLPLLGITVDIAGTSLILPFKEVGNMSTLVAELRAGSSAVAYQGPLVTLSHRWIGDILRGLLYLHTEGIIHGDLRGSNVLLEDDLTAVIADFGLSHFANGHSKNYASRRSGNVEWLSPELLSENGPNGDPRPTKESDIYSFAMVCIETYTGEPPFAHVTPTDLAFRDRVIQGTRPLRPMEPSRGGQVYTERMNDKLWALLQDCWHGERTRRPDAVEVEERLRELQYIS